MNEEELKKLSNTELNNILKASGFNPCVESDEDRETAISILSQI